MDYIKIIILFLYYVGLLLLCCNVSKKILITPEFCFVSSFVPHIFYALFYVKRWNLDINSDTFFVYLFGGMIFVLSSMSFSILLGKVNLYSTASEKIVKIDISKWFLVGFVIFQVASLYITMNAVRQLTNRPNILEAIDMFGFFSKGSGLQMPSLPGKLNMICYTSSYIWLYDILHSLQYKYKTHTFLLMINLGLSVVHHVLTGSRGGVVELLISGMVFVYFFRGDKKHWKNVIVMKSLIKGIIIGTIGIVLFRFSVELLGRTGIAGETISDYIARYLSASMKNLDTKIQNGAMGFQSIEQWKTTNSIMSTFSRIFGFNIERNIGASSTYMSVNGFGLGNVYTIYYPFINDLSYLGLFIFIPIMSLVSQVIYKSALKFNRFNGNKPGASITLVLYGYMISKIVFSFFSNRFYDNILSMGTIWCLLFWWIVKSCSEKNFVLFGNRIGIGKKHKHRNV